MIFTASRVPSTKHLQGSSALGVMSLEEQNALTRTWQGSIQTTKDVARDLHAHLQDVRATADAARKQIDEWAQAESAKNNKEIKRYVVITAQAAVYLTNIETDFKAWCFTQKAWFKVEVMLLEKKFKNSHGEVANISSECLLLNRAVDKGLKALKDMMGKIQTVQSLFSVLTAAAKQMERKIKEDMKKVKHDTAGGALTIGAAGLGCAGGILVGSAVAIASLGSGSLLGAGIGAVACGGVAVTGAVSLSACGNMWAHAMQDQVAYAHKLGKGTKRLESRAKADYDKMSTAKQAFDVVDGFLIPDVDMFKQAVVPALKDLVGILDTLANEQRILAKAV